jgi:RNA polymerase sigma-70 factor (ECF subfamily)
MAYLATGNREDALDIVQDSMFKLVQKYAARPGDEWPLLFQCILQSRIRDWYRRTKVRSYWHILVGGEVTDNPLANAAETESRGPQAQAMHEGAMQRLEQGLRLLPPRQQQALLLRVWEGLNVSETARAMGCTEGSVKTHFSRAVHALREYLGEHWP